MLSQFNSNAAKEQKKVFLKALGDFPEGIMPIGRLDEKSEGLLLLTTDGKLSHEINSSGIEKEYYALVDGAITDDDILKLQNGVEIGFNGKKYMTKPCKVFKLTDTPSFPDRKKKIRDARHGPTTWISITLTEGKFRQVRKMTSAVNCPTLRLVRVRIGNIHLDDMLISDVVKLENIKPLI
ncbi:pseudouridine synthase [Aurantibacter aestuarii]|uniref:Pseudouridine synthase n=1 Tax=Aurantibacter aestuarii TaxID=1266046 RepID=A0A2T1N8K8_9FLAO|nr:pseudouridine synthase [Aurantibacter aestuarii]PSG88163.1 ribulose phosphate epimerase [Aurantibacter aestuarii]